ncbi:DUF4190 domain-containing protein [Tersicoccus sp. MR15.9]|uniref:DUF4190 domain-containing protein n=1 Tax=Tersicoccus mangrovi TaxID=3121635 RepID=UPI002FE67108
MSNSTPPPPSNPDGPQGGGPWNGPTQGAGGPAGQAPGYGQPQAYDQSAGYGQPPVARRNPGMTIGIVGLVLSALSLLIFGFLSIPGLILSVIGLQQSRRAGMRNVPAIIGTVVGAIALILWIIVLVARR